MRRRRLERERELREAIYMIHLRGCAGRYWRRRLEYLRGKLRRELALEPPMLFIAYEPDDPERAAARQRFNDILKIFVSDRVVRAEYLGALELLGVDVGEHGSYSAAKMHMELLERRKRDGSL